MKIRTQRKGLREHWRKREASHEKRMNLATRLSPSLNNKNMPEENLYKAGWCEHPGTHCGHYFDEGEAKSLCKKEFRGAGADVKDDCFYKCSICDKRKNEERTRNLFN